MPLLLFLTFSCSRVLLVSSIESWDSRERIFKVILNNDTIWKQRVPAIHIHFFQIIDHRESSRGTEFADQFTGIVIVKKLHADLILNYIFSYRNENLIIFRKFSAISNFTLRLCANHVKTSIVCQLVSDNRRNPTPEKCKWNFKNIY